MFFLLLNCTNFGGAYKFNSHEKLKEALENFEYTLSEKLIEDLSYFMTDMRLLYNTVNEFHIYYQKFRGSENQGENFKDKLFAMVAYKNIYPEDFAKLDNNDGKLYNFLTYEKQKWINKKSNTLEADLDTLKGKLETSKKEMLEDITDLRRIYLLEYIDRLKNFSTFSFEKNNISIANMLEEDNFEKLISQTVFYKSINYNIENSIDISLEEIEENLGSKPYRIREESIKSKEESKRQELLQLINQKKIELNEIRSSKISYILKDSPPIFDHQSKEKQLILLLLQNGYIAEDYANYISYFYPGEISENDRWYIMNVENEIDSEYDYPIQQTENVINKLNILWIENP